MTKEMESDKIGYLDGLRGLASLIVVFHHYACGFYPTLIFGNERVSHNPFEISVYRTPFNLFVAGNFAVCIFFVLSGFVLSNKFFKFHKQEELLSLALRRYFRLMVPVFFSVFIAFCLMKLGLFFNKEAAVFTYSKMWLSNWWTFNPDFSNMLSQGFYDAFISGKSSYNGNLWTMQCEFLGSFLVFGFLSLFGNYTKRLLIYFVLLIVLWKTYYLGFVFGVMLCDFSAAQNKRIGFKEPVRGILLALLAAVGLFLGSYPMFNTKNTIYHMLYIHQISAVENYMFYHAVGAFLLLLILLNSNRLKYLFSVRIMQYLGKISFSLYLLHLIVICSFSSFLFNLFIHRFSYNTSFLLMFFPSLLINFILAGLYHRFVDLNGIKLAGFLVKKHLLRKEKIPHSSEMVEV